ncbi:MAG: thioredoxin domain-containing protein [Candidatus Binatia bacterium]
MTKWIGFACVLGLAASLHTCQPGQSSGPVSDAERQQIDQRVKDYFKKAANLPANLSIKVTDLAPSEVHGLLTAKLEVSNGTNTQRVPFVVSRDGHFLIQGQLTDLTIDPYKAAMDKISLKGQPVRGKADAPITIVEYSDFECPFCSRAYKMLEDQLLKDYGDQVRLVFKNFPLTNIHPWAQNAALAGECALQQSPEAFWKVYDFLFQNQGSLNAANLKEKIDEQAEAAGLDAGRFDSCFDDKKALDAVKADQQEATALGVRSTPTFFINGRKVEGAMPYDTFKKILDQALKPTEAGAKGPDTGSSAQADTGTKGPGE